jgi:phosphate transport system substrate-binding protein
MKMDKKNQRIAIAAIVIIAIIAVGAYYTNMSAPTGPTSTQTTPATTTPPSNGLSGSLTIAGSTTVLPLNQEWARILMEANPDLRISVSGGGSGHGIKAVGSGEIDIGAASRDVKSDEMDTYPDIKPIAVAMDSIAIVVHPSNPLTDISMEDVAKIYAGEITNFKEIGGPDMQINVYTREEGSGTRGSFEEQVLDKYEVKIFGRASVKPSNGEMRAAVAGNEKGFAYISLGYVDNTVKALNIDGVQPTIDNVISGSYKISRKLYLITKGPPSALEQAFIDFALSPKGQEVVTDGGYIAISSGASSVTTTSSPKTSPTPTSPASNVPTGLSGSLTIAGSTTVLPLNQEWARILMEANPDLRISVSGGGSGAGIKSIGAGTVDIGAASRDITDIEMSNYPDIVPIAVAKDSIVIIVHPSNPITDISMEDIAKIYSGQITNFKQLGGPDMKMNVYTREEGSGTRGCFEELVLIPHNVQKIIGEAYVKPSNGEMRASVANDEAGLAYISLGYLDQTVKALNIDGVQPTIANVKSGAYPIIRNLYLITKGEPEGLKKAFIEFALSDEGQKVVTDGGYMTIK